MQHSTVIIFLMQIFRTNPNLTNPIITGILKSVVEKEKREKEMFLWIEISYSFRVKTGRVLTVP